MGIAKTTFFFFLSFSSAFADLGWEKAAHHRRKLARQRKTRCSGYIHPCIQHLYCLSAVLPYFWNIQQWENTSPVLNVFLQRVLYQTGQEYRTSRYFCHPCEYHPELILPYFCLYKHWASPLSWSHTVTWPCIMQPECHYESQLWGHPLAWISPQKSCSKKLSLPAAERARGAIFLLSSASSPPASRHGLLCCLQETAREKEPTASQIRKHKACPAVCCSLRIFQDELQEETLNPNLLDYMGQVSWLYWWLSCPNVDLHKLFNYSCCWVQEKNLAFL